MHRPTPRFLVLLAGFVLLPLALGALVLPGPRTARAEDAPAQKPEAPRHLELAGKLRRQVVKEGARYVVDAGASPYLITPGPDGARVLDKLVGRYVVVVRTRELAVRPWLSPIPLGAGIRIAKDAPVTLAGYVRVELKGMRKERWFLETKNGRHAIDARSARKFRRFENLHVEAKGARATNGRNHHLEAVTKVERKLAPGERDPKKGDQAFEAAWRGQCRATEVPAGVPGARKGEFPIAFSVPPHVGKPKKIRPATGRLFDTYDIVGVRVTSFTRKKRRATLDVHYSFGKGSYTVTFEGTFSSDWRRFEGTWTSGFLGSGTFAYSIPTPGPAAAKDR